MKLTILIATRCYLQVYRTGAPLMRAIANMLARLGDKFGSRSIFADRQFKNEKVCVGMEPDVCGMVDKAGVFDANKRMQSLFGCGRLPLAQIPAITWGPALP